MMDFDLFAVNTLLGGSYSEEGFRFLSRLIQHSREGNLCMVHEGAIPLSSALIEEGNILFPKAPIIRQKDRIYLQKNWVYETYILQHMERLRKRKSPQFHDAKRFHDELAKMDRLTLEQKQVICRVFEEPFSVICGGPGTGKTYTAGFLVHLLCASLNRAQKERFVVALAAPTGKAALHLKASILSQGCHIPCEAFTLHRLLKLQPGETKLFSGKQIDADLILVDEASMIDISLFAHLVEAVRDEARLILMGDPNQLPPVGTGSFFAECSELFGVSLRRCLRTEESVLQSTAEAIRNEDAEKFFTSLSYIDSIDETLVDHLYEKINPLIVSETPDPIACLQHYQKCRVLNALRKGPWGTEALNRQILERMDKQCKKGQWWAIPILITANAPRYELYNGVFGILIGQKSHCIDLFEGQAYFPESESRLSKATPFELSFCLSIHKSQGSEFEEVIALFPQGSENFGKESLYTAATRAQKSLQVIGEKEILRKMLKTSSRKMSGLIERYRLGCA